MTASNPTPALKLLLLIALTVIALHGCAYAPGMYIGKGAPSVTQPPNTVTRPDYAAGPPPPPGALLAITPELIRQQRLMQKTALGAEVTSLFAESRPYTIGTSDVVNIVVWNHPELVLAPAGSTLTADSSGLAAVGNGYNVSPEGLIQFPLIGFFKIAGMTETDARNALVERLAKYINNPDVTLRVQAYRAGRVYVDGEVRTPGQQAITDLPMTLPEALSRAGGLTAVADRATISITRKGMTSVVNLPKMTELGVNPARILLAPGDLVRVGSRDDSKVYVLGEVSRPAALPLRSGRLTLNEALGESGGVSPVSGNPRQIYVVRSRSGEPAAGHVSALPEVAAIPLVFHLDANSPTAYAMAEGFELKAHDVVFVDPVPLVLWNRVISLVLPSAQVVNVTRDAVN